MTAFCLEVQAQNSARRLLAKADSARLDYDFQSAVDLCQKAVSIDSTSKTKAEEMQLLAQNGLNMMAFCSQPVVVARQTFSLKDFFLFYPLQDQSWRTVPNQLDSLGGDPLSSAMYIPENAKDIYYSAKDVEGIRNIYRTTHADSLWSPPRLINEQLTSSSDEIFPMLSPDGQSLYFASEGLYGMGGYDLYVSRWNSETKDWDVPVNMGFPYSSPYDDFLFINTDDGKYSIFASNRSCSKDSVCIYVLEYDEMPVRKNISDVKELKELSSLAPEADKSRIDNGTAVSGNLQNAETQRYVDKMKEVRTLRDSVYSFGKNLDNLRLKLASADEKEKESLSSLIAEKEQLLPALKDTLSRAVKSLQNIEMEFLQKGIVIDNEKLQAEADKEVVGASSGYAFTKNSMGGPFHLQIRKQKPSFDYSFKILPEGKFAESNTLPSGLIYQIQLFSQPKKATAAELKGLSPVFEKLYSSRYTYSAGVFRSYKDVLSKLNTVKHKGFHDAIIVAWMDGAPVKVAKAREMESKLSGQHLVRIFPENGESLSEEVLALIKKYTDKDIVKGVEAGSVVFKVGPLDEMSVAEEIKKALVNAGVGSVSIEDVPSEQ